MASPHVSKSAPDPLSPVQEQQEQDDSSGSDEEESLSSSSSSSSDEEPPVETVKRVKPRRRRRSLGRISEVESVREADSILVPRVTGGRESLFLAGIVTERTEKRPVVAKPMKANQPRRDAGAACQGCQVS